MIIIIIIPAITTMPRDDCEEPEYLRKIFIGNLSFNTTDESLRDFFSEFGEIVDSVVMKNKETGKSRGFGFVTYSESGMVDGVQSTRPHKVCLVKCVVLIFL